MHNVVMRMNLDCLPSHHKHTLKQLLHLHLYWGLYFYSVLVILIKICLKREIKKVWSQSSGILPLSFFQLSLQDWLQSNATADKIILHLQLPWHIYFPFFLLEFMVS